MMGSCLVFWRRTSHTTPFPTVSMICYPYTIITASSSDMNVFFGIRPSTFQAVFRIFNKVTRLLVRR